MVLNNFWFQFQHPKNEFLENNNIFILILKISTKKIEFLTFKFFCIFSSSKMDFLIKKDPKTKKWKKIKVPYLLKSPFLGVMNTQDQKTNSLQNPFLRILKMEQGDEQKDDE